MFVTDLDSPFAPWDGRRVPVTFLGGYLGAGKTTVLNELLARTSLRVAVLVNDVGSVNIDAKLIKSTSGSAVELTDGCVCCSLSEGFLEAFDQLRKRPEPPDHVVVELSGVAEPDRVRPWASTPGFKLDGVAVLVDASQYLAQVDSDPIGQYVRRQVQAADLLVVTKTDLVDEATLEEVSDRLKVKASGCRIIHSTSPTALAALVELGGRQPVSEVATPETSLFDSHTVELMPTDDMQSVESLQEVVAGLVSDDAVVRVKGIVETTDAGLQLVQAVGSRCSVTQLTQAENAEPTGLVIIRVD